jgi:hypothetical protein
MKLSREAKRQNNLNTVEETFCGMKMTNVIGANLKFQRIVTRKHKRR